MGSGFDFIAPVYDRLVWLVYGQSLKKAQTDLLPELQGIRRVLILGGGTGWILQEIGAKLQPELVCYADSSSNMIRLSKEAWQKRGSLGTSVEFVQGGREDLPPNAVNFDLIVTNFYLDLFPDSEQSAILSDLQKRLAPGGHWYFTDFHKVSSGWMKPVSRTLIFLMYRFFRFCCKIPASDLPEFLQHFSKTPLSISRKKERFGGMILAILFKSV